MFPGRYSLIALLFVLGLVGFDPSSRPAVAGDWPQILGPSRNGQAIGETLDAARFKKTPAVHWSYAVGAGFAGPAVVGDRVIVFHRLGDQERVECLSAATGKPQWQTNFPASYQGGANPDDGPRCVPTIHAGRIYLFGADGDLYCVDLKTGKKILDSGCLWRVLRERWLFWCWQFSTGSRWKTARQRGRPW
ncbi:MAG: PQQ-binding-like beta-propeller repeat protein [Pirellulaceae bacterium]